MKICRNIKKAIWMVVVLLLLLLISENIHIVHAEETGIYTLKTNKTYQYDLDGDGKKESVKIKLGKYDGYRYCELYIYVNEKKSLIVKEKYGFMGADVKLLIMSKKKVFFYVHPSGESDDGLTALYQYEHGKLKKSIDFENMGRWASVRKVSKRSITMEISESWSAVGYFSYKCDLIYKNGRLVPDSKTYKLYFYSPTENGKHSRLTAKNNIQLYQTHNTKKRSFVLKKGQEVKVMKYYLNGKIKMFQIKTKSGKTGWLVDQNGNELFEEAYGVA